MYDFYLHIHYFENFAFFRILRRKSLLHWTLFIHIILKHLKITGFLGSSLLDIYKDTSFAAPFWATLHPTELCFTLYELHSTLKNIMSSAHRSFADPYGNLQRKPRENSSLAKNSAKVYHCLYSFFLELCMRFNWMHGGRMKILGF